MIFRRSTSPVCGRRMERVMSMQARPWPEPAPEVTAAVRAMYRGRKRELPLAVAVRQKAEDLTDRQAADAVRDKISWKYALGMALDDAGFDASVLSEFRTRVVEHGLEERVLDLLLAALRDKGLVKAGGKQRTDSTHVVSAVRDLNRLELAGESVRACAEALAVAAPDWLSGTVAVPDWNRRYGVRVNSWKLPSSPAKREELAVAYGRDGFTLLAAVYAPDAPAWLVQLPAVEVLRTVLLQNYTRTVTEDGQEVVKRREADTDGLPPGRQRLSSPYDLDARWGVKRDKFWNGYKVHVSETCDIPGADAIGDTTNVTPPNLITNVATTDATVPDSAMTEPIHRQLAARGLLPAEHYLDSGYPSAELIAGSWKTFGIALVTPVLADVSPQARAGAGFDRSAFTIDFDQQQATCPQNRTSNSWTPASQRGTDTIVIKFAAGTCGPCPVRDQCATSKRGYRQLTVQPREAHDAQREARARQDTKDWQSKYTLRAGVEGTIRQAVAVTGLHHARYRGLAKTHLDHVFSAVALNLIRLDAFWNGHPLDRGRTSRLARLELALAA